MAKKKTGSTVFKCSSCSYTQPRWLGRCPECGEWNTFEETATTGAVPIFGAASKGIRAKPVPLSNVDSSEGTRISTGIGELDRVLGGGAMKRSAVLMGGEPGIGKSTLLLQAASSIQTNGKILYVSGEESASQIKNRAERLRLPIDKIQILNTVLLDDINDALTALNPVFTVIDSIQTVYSAEAGIVPGTVNQLKYCSNELIQWVKERDSVLFMSAHVTKEGIIAGPKVLEHMVDAVIAFERSDDKIRFLRAQKNRFGSIDELGIFAMEENGLIPVEDPSSLFITKRKTGLPAGVAVVPVFEGSRVFMVEIQALTVPAKASLTRVYSDKIDSARVSRVAAVLEKRAGIRLSDHDLYINVAGGVRLTESAIDASLAAALYSARTDIPCPAGTAFVGELSLAGEVRPVNRLKQRVKTAQNLGFSTILCPFETQDEKDSALKQIHTIKDLITGIVGSTQK